MQSVPCHAHTHACTHTHPITCLEMLYSTKDPEEDKPTSVPLETPFWFLFVFVESRWGSRTHGASLWVTSFELALVN